MSWATFVFLMISFGGCSWMALNNRRVEAAIFWVAVMVCYLAAVIETGASR